MSKQIMGRVAIGAIIGALAFFLISSFVVNSFDYHVMAWEPSSRAWLLYFACVGALIALASVKLR